jgi:hypothetical protein
MTDGPAGGLRLSEVVIDCADHGRVVDFWAAALGYERREVNQQYVALLPPAREPGGPLAPEPGGPPAREPGQSAAGEPGQAPAREVARLPLLFQKVPEPKAGKNRVHLDFRAPVMADEVARLVGLGATVIAERSLGDFSWTVMSDPEGNEFCVAGD